MKITGTFKNGKYFRGNGRWAKVLVTKLSSRTIISCAYGFEGERGARDIHDNIERQSQAKEYAIRFIETGDMW